MGESNAMWGGRFAAGPADIMNRINVSVDYDRRFYAEDIAGSIAHARMLGAQGVIAAADSETIIAGLEAVRADIAAGRFTFDPALEDVHMNVEAALRAKIGAAAGRLHTARSRNDQAVTDLRLWLRGQIDQLDAGLADLQRALIEKAEAHAAAAMPGFTHLQPAQPVTFGHHMMAYVEMIGRDRGRFADARGRLNECPLGAAALAGTAFPIDRDMTAELLDFARPTRNSMDSVSDRDFALEYLSAASILAMHLSRLAEELVLWTSEQFRFVSLSDAFTTGSSIMPQKRNADAAELVRGKAGRVTGALVALTTMMKGLPLAYGKDMQEDKEPLFDAVDTIALCVAASAGMIDDMSVHEDALRAACEGEHGFITATDLADWLVRTLDMPFREAHHIVGAVVARAEDLGCTLADLPLADLKEVEPRITADVYAALTVDAAVQSRASFGGTAPARVREAAAAARGRWLGETS